MPPVLGPVSPSPTRLWSCAVASGSAVSPSTRAKKLASSPGRNCSITISSPAAPNRCSASISRAAARASSRVWAITTPLPAASPSALTTTGSGRVAMKDSAARRSVKRPYSRRRNAVARAQVLGERLGSFQPRRRGGGAESLDARFFEPVDESRDQRRLGTHDDEVDTLLPGEAEDAVDVLRRDGNASGVRRDSGVSWRTEKRFDQRRGGDRPAQRMLAPPAADHQHPHRPRSPYNPRQHYHRMRRWRRLPPFATTERNVVEFSVSEISQAVKRTLEGNFEHVRVRGEVGRPNYHGSGHLYFTLKGRFRLAGRCLLAGHGGAARAPARGGYGSRLHRADFVLPAQLALSDRRRSGRARGGGGRFSSCSKTAASGSPPRVCSTRHASKTFLSCRTSSVSSLLRQAR